EFRQIDVEMSLVEEKDVQRIVEGLPKALWGGVLGYEVTTPFARLSYDDAMTRYGSDKPDLRLDLELADVTEPARACGFQIFEKAVAAGGIVKAMRGPDGERLSRPAPDAMPPFPNPSRAKGLPVPPLAPG